MAKVKKSGTQKPVPAIKEKNPQRGRNSRVIGLGKFRSGISDLGSEKNHLGKFGQKIT